MRVVGECSPEELVCGFGDALQDEDVIPGTGLLIDVTASRTLPPVEVMRQVAAVIGSARERIGTRVAVVVAHQVRFGKARQLGMLLESSGIEVRPFYEREDAVNWLRERYS